MSDEFDYVAQRAEDGAEQFVVYLKPVVPEAWLHEVSARSKRGLWLGLVGAVLGLSGLALGLWAVSIAHDVRDQQHTLSKEPLDADRDRDG